MFASGKDSIFLVAAIPLLLAVLVAHWLLWRVTWRGRRGATPGMAVAVVALTTFLAALLMIMSEWLPYMPDDLKLDDAEAIGPGLLFLGVNLAVLMGGATVVPAVIATFAGRDIPDRMGGKG